jgi:hypothetical protein
MIRLDAYEGIITFKYGSPSDNRAQWYKNVWFQFNYDFAREWNATIGYYTDGDDESDRGRSGMYLEFENDSDASAFLLRWS